MGGLKVEVVAAGGPLWSGRGSFVTAPTPLGSIGIYPKHQPLLSLLGEGEVRVDAADGGAVRVVVEGGFLSVDSDVVTVVTDHGEVVG
ncbi:MAG: F0F1 ATP synthase subunit epsilon [Micrococcales bacterium]|nr:F0F1 ATP synthase subunit epsilon [Micrococcales bacterium]